MTYFALTVSLIIYMGTISFRKIPLLSIYNIFFLFTLLYSFVYIFDLTPHRSVALYSLFYDYEIRDIHITSVSLSLIGFFLPVLIWKKNANNNDVKIIIKKFNFLKYISFLLLFFIILGGYFYPWGSGRPEIINSILGNLKVVSGVILIFLLLFSKKDLLFWILISLFILATLVEGSRTSFIFFVITAILMYGRLLSKSLLNKKKILIIFAFILLILFSIFIAIKRINFNLSSFSDILYPIFAEGIYGSYMALQSYYLVDLTNNYTYFMQYFIDPIIFIIPRVFFVLLGLNKDAFTFSNSYISEYSFLLTEPYGPHGGFYYVADAFIAGGYIGVFLVSFVFSFIHVKLDNKKLLSKPNKLFYYIFVMTFFLPFIKHPISQSSHFFIVGLIVYFFLRKKIKYN